MKRQIYAWLLGAAVWMSMGALIWALPADAAPIAASVIERDSSTAGAAALQGEGLSSRAQANLPTQGTEPAEGPLAGPKAASGVDNPPRPELTSPAGSTDLPDTPIPQDPDALLQEQLDASGAGELVGQLPEETQEFLGDAFGDVDIKTLIDMKPDELLQALGRFFLEQWKKPAAVLCAVFGAVVLCAMLSGLGQSVWNRPVSEVFGVVSCLFIITAIIQPIISCITDTGRIIRECSLFILSFVPVFGSIIAVGGQPATATTYNMLLFGSCQFFSQIIASTILPLLYIFLALCIVSSCAPALSLSGTIQTIRTLMNWFFIFVMTIFAAIFSAQTIVSVGTDNVGVKTTKFLIGSFVPVIGSVISDALITAQGYLRILKTTVGAFGILAVLVIFLPVLLKVLLWMATVKLAGIAADILDIKVISALLRSINSCLAILVSLLVSYALFLVITIVLMLSFSMG